jgi:RHS repeat-associated protein
VVSGDDFGFEFGPGSGGVLARQFDENRNLVSLTVMNQPAPLGVEESGVVDLLYNPDGQLAEIRRPAGGDTRFHYDSIGRLTHRSERVSEGGTAAWQTTTLGYDASGRLTSRSLPNGGMETWTYGPGGRLRSASVQEDGVQQSRADYTYQNGRLVSILDDAYGIASETLHHDAETGLLERVVYPTGESIRYERDLRGRIVSRTLVRADGSVLRRIQYEYDSAGREKRILDGGTLLLERKRDGGKIVWIKYGNQMKHSRQYDGFDGSLVSSRLKQTDTGRIEAETVFESLYGAPCLSDVCFSAYTTAQHSLSAALESYQVGTAIGSDDLKMSGRRVVQGPGDDFQDVGTKFFEFDLLSNLVKMSNHYEPRCGDQTGELTAVYNAERNRLLRMDWSEGCTGVAHAYSYDEAGYVIERDGVQIDWDGAGRALRVGDMAEFEWDTQGRMVSRTLDGIRTVFLYGGFVEADASLEPVAIDLGDVRISLVAGVGNRYRHYDFRGNVQFVTDESGFIVKHYRYGAFGALQQVGDSDDPFAFGRGLSVEGLVLLGARLLDQDAGRFLGPDPEFQILNQHSYTMGNPVFLWDPDGRSAIAVPTPPAIGPTEAGWGWTAFYTTAVYGGGLVGFRLGGQFGVVPGALAGFIVAENVYQISTGRQGTSWRDILEHFDPSVAPKGSPKPADYYRNLSADSGRPGTKAKGLHAQGPDAGYVDDPISIGGFACGLGFEAGLGVAIAFGLRRRLRRRSTLQSPSRGRRGHPDGE